MVFSSSKSKKGTGSGGASSAGQRQEQCVALCDYYTANDDEISFKKGDVITVVTKGNDSGFWSGYVAATSLAGTRKAKKDNHLNSSSTSTEKAVIVTPSNTNSQIAPNGNKIGLFPNCMVTSNCRLKAGEKSFLNKASAMYSYEPKDLTEMRFEKYDVMTIVGPSPHAGWWLAVNETAKKRLAADAADSAARGGNLMHSSTVVEAVAGTFDKPLLVPTNFLTCDIVAAMYAFQGREKHELSFAAGDVLHVKRKWNDGWWEAILNGQRGIFPSNYTDPNVCTLDPPLFCSHCKAIFNTSTLGALNDCKACGRHEEIVQSMKRALESFCADKENDQRNGVTATSSSSNNKKCDLFEYIELDPKIGGRAALLTPADIIKSAGGGVGKGVAGVTTGLANLHLSHQHMNPDGTTVTDDGHGGAISPDQYADAQINDDEIFHRRGETKSVLTEIEKKRAEQQQKMTYAAGSYGMV